MDQHVAVFLVVAIIVITIAWVIISWYNFRLKKRIIESGPVNEEALGFLKNLSPTSNTESLKWGCIIFAGGLGLVILQFIPYAEYSALPYGLEAMFIAAGFLTYYYLVNRKPKQ
ncbi:hypothetical protein SAMN05216490_2120 [Mucilaginibacter mallensis]|uniref:DUF6249 domain-containing protein n=1 Tax=Mucilaginibacter mallensis TaxID=652787 RepID=A0A1H1WAN6_MUCMA|nr:DUF6249 domain-containing protein [Mucilaginibacter mallensis]SDS93209.1 hypothetical protein SAMN05216490_2120 [Mucilaginibacter mallensis]